MLPPTADAPRRRPRRTTLLLGLLLALGLLTASAGSALAQPVELDDAPAPAEDGLGAEDGDEDPLDVPDVAPVPEINIGIDDEEGTLSRAVTILLLLTVGSVAPGIMLLMTTFTRFVVVLGLAKNALALQTVPPAQVLVGLAMFMSFFVMNPVLTEVNQSAVQPMLAGEIGQAEAVEVGFAPLREFMLAQTRDSDLRMFMDLADAPAPETTADVPASTLIPAFVVSELRTAFIIGFVIFVPFLVIDLVVAAVLMSMGMVMLPPVFISLPLKLLLFVLVDGWVLIVGSLISSVNGVT